MQLHTTVLGAGERIVFVHGTMTTSGRTWDKQAPLAERWSVVLVDRRGYEPNPPSDFSDFEVDGADIADLLEPGDHLVGHSYGAMGAMWAAARRPDAVRSLTVIEPPALGLLRGDPDVEERIAAVTAVRRDVRDPREFHLMFAGMTGAPTDAVPDPLPAPLERLVRILMNERQPWDAPPPVDELRSAGVPTLIVSGGWFAMQERMCDALARAIGPTAERAVVTGRGHLAHRTGAAFNDALEAFVARAD